MVECIDHLNFTNGTCPDCGLEVDSYGNTESQFDYCSFPDCGCDGARLCTVGEASKRALSQNVENMWSGKTREQRRAVMTLVGSLVGSTGREQASVIAPGDDDG